MTNPTDVVDLEASIIELDLFFQSIQGSSSIDMERFETLINLEDAYLDALSSGKATQEIILVPTDFPTLQDAINAAKPGTYIQVSAGTYTENININNKSDLRIFTDGGLVTLNGKFTLSHSDHILIRGFTIIPASNDEYAIHMTDGAFEGMRFSKNTIEFQTISTYNFGIYMDGNFSVTKQNTIRVNGKTNEYGIYQFGNNNIHTGNMLSGQAGDLSIGILSFGNHNLFKQNTAQNFRYGMQIGQGSQYATVVGCTTNNNTEYGIRVAGTNTKLNENKAQVNGICDIIALVGHSTGSLASNNTTDCISGF